MPVCAGVMHFVSCLVGAVPRSPPQMVVWQISDTKSCNLFNLGGIKNCCKCLVGDEFKAGTHQGYYSRRCAV